MLEKQESFLYHISTIIVGVLPLHGLVFFFGSAVFIGCGGEKMTGIPKMPSPLLTGTEFPLTINCIDLWHKIIVLMLAESYR